VKRFVLVVATYSTGITLFVPAVSDAVRPAGFGW